MKVTNQYPELLLMMNGGAIFHSSRRQTSVSMTSTEAEVKAASLLVHHLEYVISLWSELAGSKHGTVRCILDNQTAIKHISSGEDSGASSSYLRYKCFAESKSIRIRCGLISFLGQRTLRIFLRNRFGLLLSSLKKTVLSLGAVLVLWNLQKFQSFS